LKKKKATEKRIERALENASRRKLGTALRKKTMHGNRRKKSCTNECRNRRLLRNRKDHRKHGLNR